MPTTLLSRAADLPAGTSALEGEDRLRSTALPRCHVAAVMKRDVVTARPDFSIDTVADVLVAAGSGAVPIVDAERRPIGIVTLLDVMREWHAVGDDEEREPNSIRLRDLGRERTEPGLHGLRAARTTVGEIMAPLVLTLPLDACVVEAAAVMSELGVHCLVVVDDKRAVAGLVTTFEVAGWVSREGESGHAPGCSRAHPR